MSELLTRHADHRKRIRREELRQATQGAGLGFRGMRLHWLVGPGDVVTTPDGSPYVIEWDEVESDPAATPDVTWTGGSPTTATVRTPGIWCALLRGTNSVGPWPAAPPSYTRKDMRIGARIKVAGDEATLSTRPPYPTSDSDTRVRSYVEALMVPRIVADNAQITAELTPSSGADSGDWYTRGELYLDLILLSEVS